MNHFKKICQQNYIRIYNYIYAMTGEPFLAEDLTQEVFLIALQKGQAFLEHEKPEAFLYRTAKIKVLEAMRKAERNRCAELHENMAAERGEPFSELMRQRDQAFDEQNSILWVLEELTEEQKELYESYYVAHKSMREIAREKRIRESALKMKYVRLRRKVQQIVRELSRTEEL